MKLPLSWLREFVDVPTDTSAVALRLGACGFAVDGIDGEVFDVDVTANRPDGMSVYGLAREIACAYGMPLAPAPGSSAPAAGGQAPIKASIGDAGCGRYALAVVDVTVGPSPQWLIARLSDCGVRPINNVVDVTNYVMLETGQPMHAFDASKLSGPEIRVRRARAGEKLATLDGTTRELDETMLVIADHDTAVAIAGVMGGASSEVSAATTRIALESAWFLPSSVRATSRKLGLKTEASMRFERGADVMAPAIAIARALELFTKVGAGRLSGGVTDIWTKPTDPRRVPLRQTRLDAVLGTTVPPKEAETILGRLAFGLTAVPGGWEVTVPSFRIDITREADLIEEVGRHWGLDRIEARFPALREMPRPSVPAIQLGRRVRRLLCGAGLQEAVTFTFIETAAATPYAPTGDLVTLANPLSEKFAVMRPSLVPGLLESLTYNRYRQAASVRLFELGTTFSVTQGERSCVGWVLSGPRAAHWSETSADFDFSDAKGVAELLASSFEAPLDVARADDLPWLVPGQRAALTIDGARVGWIGCVAGTDSNAAAVFAGELALGPIGRADTRRSQAISALPRYPTIVRDLSLIVDERLPAADVRGTIRTHAPATIVGIREFDRYQGKGVPEGHVSLSVRLSFQSTDRTLTDAEVQQAIDEIVAALGRAHGATLRGR
jgi:phenylalanyl-tRNA synthetase beta chain